MYKKRIFVISVLMFFIMCMGVVSASDSNDKILNLPNHDTGSSVKNHKIDKDSSISPVLKEKSVKLNVSGKTFDDIGNTMKTAKDNDKIELEGTYKSSGNTIIIDKSITLYGNKSATLDANSNSSIIKIIDGNVVLKNINFVNAKNDAIFNFGDKCTIINCSFYNTNIDSQKDNSELDIFGTYNGFKINSKSELFIINSTFKKSDICISSDDKIHIFNSNFNQLSGDGYILYLYGDSDIDSCTFKNIQSRYDYEFGGGIIFNKGNLKIRNSNFINNTFDMGIYNPSGSKNLKVVNTNFLNNNGFSLFYMSSVLTNGLYRSSKLTMDSCKIINNNLHSAIYSVCSNITVKGTMFKNNLLKSQIFLNNHDKSRVNVIDCIFDSCRNIDRGAIFLGDRYTKLYITNKGKTQEYKNVCVIDGGFNKKNLCYCKVNKFKTPYNSGKWFDVKTYYTNTNNPFYVYYDDMDEWGYPIYDSDCYVVLKAYTGKKSKKYEDQLYNGNYIASFNLSNLPLGKHKIEVSYYYNGYKVFTKTSSIEITKARTIVQAPSVTAKKGKSKYFKITLKHKNTKKTLSGIKLKVKIYTDKKYKTYTLTTNKKGIAQLNINKLKKGNHKVIIQSGNKNYAISAKSIIKIK